MIPPKAVKILTLALDSAAHDGEWRNAAVMFVSILRTEGTQAAELLAPSPRPTPQWTPPPYSNPYEVRMPFGLHKGKRLSSVPADYLRWLLGLKNLKPELRRAVEAELSKP
jgi:hypothetical protein